MKKQNIPATTLILLSACFSPTPMHKAKLAEAIATMHDWEKAKKLVIERQGAGLVLRKLDELGLTDRVPEGVIQAWKQARLKTISRHIVLAEHFRKVMTAFNENGMEVIAMKGIYLSEGLYPEPGLRQFSDIDMLVKEEQGESAIKILREMGYRIPDLIMQVPEEIAKGEDVLHFPPMTKQGVSIEVHTRLVRKTAEFSIDLDEVWRLAIPITLHGVRVKTFSSEYQFLNVAQHLDKHFRQGKFQMTGFYDLVNMAATNPFDIDWNQLIEISLKYNSFELTLEYISILVYKFEIESFGETPDLETSKTYQKIFEDVLESGISKRVMIGKVINRASTNHSWKYKIHRIIFLFFPPAGYLRTKHKLRSDQPVYKLYFTRIINQIKKLS